MDTCFWKFKIHNCNYEKLLQNISLSGLIIITILNLILLFLYIQIYRVNNRNFIKSWILFLIIANTLIITYLAILRFKINTIIPLLLFIENTIWVVISCLSIYFILIFMKIVLKNEKNLKIFLFLSLLFILPTLPFSILSGYYFSKNDYKKGYILIALNSLLWGLAWILHISYIFNYYIIYLKYLKMSYNIKSKSLFLTIISFIIILIIVIPLWIGQSIWILIDYNSYNNNIVINSFIAFLWYYGGVMSGNIFCILCFFYYKPTYNVC